MGWVTTSHFFLSSFSFVFFFGVAHKVACTNRSEAYVPEPPPSSRRCQRFSIAVSGRRLFGRRKGRKSKVRRSTVAWFIVFLEVAAASTTGEDKTVDDDPRETSGRRMDRFLRLGVSCPEATSRIVSRAWEPDEFFLPASFVPGRKLILSSAEARESRRDPLCPCLTSGIEQPRLERHEADEGEL